MSADGGAEDDEIGGVGLPVSVGLEIEELGACFADEPGDAEDVGFEHGLPLVGVGGHDRAVEPAPGVGDDEVGNDAEVILGGVEHRVDGGLVSSVAGDADGAGAYPLIGFDSAELIGDALGELVDALGPSGIEDDPSTFGRQIEGEGLPNACAGAGDDGGSGRKW